MRNKQSEEKEKEEEERKMEVKKEGGRERKRQGILRTLKECS